MINTAEVKNIFEINNIDMLYFANHKTRENAHTHRFDIHIVMYNRLVPLQYVLFKHLKAVEPTFTPWKLNMDQIEGNELLYMQQVDYFHKETVLRFSTYTREFRIHGFGKDMIECTADIISAFVFGITGKLKFTII